MTIALPPDLAALRDTICALGVEKRDLLIEAVRQETMPVSDDEIEIPQWHLDVLEERQRLFDEGKIESVPLDEAFARVRQRLAERRAEHAGKA